MAEPTPKPKRGAEFWIGVVGLPLSALATFYLLARVLAAPVGPESQAPLGQAAEGALKKARISDLLFYAFAALTVVSAAGVAFSRNIIYSAFSLLLTLLGMGALFVYLSADFLAVTQLLIYVGGVLVLILFAVMLTSHIQDIKISNVSIGLPGGVIAFLATTVLLAVVAVSTPWKVATAGPVERAETAASLGNLFLNEYLLPFEIASLVLLAALIGAVVMARKELVR